MTDYIDSKIVWIGKIPSEWKLSKYKYYTENRMGETILAEDTVGSGIPVYSATQSDDHFGYVTKSTLKLKKNDFVIPARGTIGFVTIVNDEIATCTQTTICTRNIHNIDYKYLYYQSIAFKEHWFNHDGSAVPQITVTQIENNVVLCPNETEQKMIAEFLDNKINLIEGMIDKYKKQIEILNKYKNSLITETMKNGIYGLAKKNVENKYIKSMASNYRLTKVKYVCSKVTDGSHESPEVEDGKWPFVSIVNIDNEKINFDCCLKTSENNYNKLVRQNCKPIYGDVLISKDGTVGKTIFIDFDKDFVVASSLVILRPKKNIINSKYLKYNLAADYNQEYLKQLMTGSALKRVSVEKNANLNIILTSIKEQEEIVNFLDKKCLKIDSIIAQKKKQIEKIEQYKKSVIYEYVTGKKRVKGAEELYG